MNFLAKEKSPYLLQHAENPVNWYPWGTAAFQKATAEDKPVFISIGYATCHWCHVMAHESFEDEEIARILNRCFVAIKVDREERPDVDHIYMSVCQAMTGGGGWPLTICATPQAKPFFSGTYFPKTARAGMPGLKDILNHIAERWRNDRSTILNAGEQVSEHLRVKADPKKVAFPLGEDIHKRCHAQLRAGFDAGYGGFGSAPKFPTPHQLLFLLRRHAHGNDPDALRMVFRTLTSMRNGGIYDQIGWGFHRYSVDEKWLIPHFEKMLYDQALLAMAYLEAFQVTKDPRFANTAQEIFAYVLRDMTDPEGGFYSAEDADSEGREGRFYVWAPKQIKEQLGHAQGELICRFYGIGERGNFEEGSSVAHVPVSLEAFAKRENMAVPELERRLADARQNLFDLREKRPHPLKDDKILTSWNGLMIAAFSKGFQVLGEKTYAEAARRAADFILNYLRAGDGRLLRRYREGDADYPAYLDDYAFFVWGLLDLHEATFDIKWLEQAIRLNRSMMEIFWDEQGGGLFFTGKGNEPLIIRTKEAYDGALPSGNSVAIHNLLRLAHMTGDVDLENQAEQICAAFSDQVTRYPAGHTQFLVAHDFLISAVKEIVLVDRSMNEKTEKMLACIHARYVPNKVVLLKHEEDPEQRLASLIPYSTSMRAVDGRTTAYVCEKYQCQAPVTEIAELESLLT